MHHAMNASYETRLSLPMQFGTEGPVITHQTPWLTIPLIKNTLAYSGVLPEPLLTRDPSRSRFRVYC